MNRFTRCENGVIADTASYNRLQTADSASVLLLSDTHGAIDAVRWILSAFSGKCQACLFAGDGAQDIITAAREAAVDRLTIPPVIIMVQGNCDNQLYPPLFPGNGNSKSFGLSLYQQKQIARQRIFLTHGHLHHVEIDGRKLSITAEYSGCTIAVHGHMHVQSIETFGSVTTINPGSPLRPRGKSYGGFAVLSINTGRTENTDNTPATENHRADYGKTVPLKDIHEKPYLLLQFYRLIQGNTGAFSAAVHREYSIPIRNNAV